MALLASVALAAIALGIYFVVRPDPVAVAPPSSERPGVVTVSVRPFEMLGAGREHAYLASGITSDLMTDLSRLSGLRLIGVPDKAAQYLVAGTVQREGETLRINVRLTDGRSGEQVWSQRYERPYGDLFAVQSDITRRLTEQLPATISEAERRRLAQRYTGSLEAYEHFLRGQALFLVRRTEENRQARALYAKAVELDPRFARAYAGLALTHAMDYRYQKGGASSAALARALELAETARLIDPEIPDIYWALGFVHTQSRRHDQALKALQRAVELNPSYADAYALMGGIHTYIGEPAKSVPLLRAALRLNPEGGSLYFLLLGRAYLFQNDLEQALINLREALARNPDNLETRLFLAATLVAQGNLAAAEWEADQIRAQEAGFSAGDWLKTYPLTSARHQESLRALLVRVGL